ncbi:hypothetical protein PR048_018973 [Dryococelus australis]|uniref:Uncharacterized protein n=1 Tax=Dryococelus australis TaxID=614101 RepID=A0ABQ9H2A3_9NEOP|nr:hypothetical protein PR048_018973 [Dryococelus australis]
MALKMIYHLYENASDLSLGIELINGRGNVFLLQCSWIAAEFQSSCEAPNPNDFTLPKAAALPLQQVRKLHPESVNKRTLIIFPTNTAGIGWQLRAREAERRRSSAFILHTQTYRGHGERLARSPPTNANRVFACGNRARRCRWSGGLSREPPAFHTLSFRRCSILTSITLIDSQDLAPLVHTAFGTFWRAVAQPSPSAAIADNQCTVHIGISVHKTVESSLQCRCRRRLPLWPLTSVPTCCVAVCNRTYYGDVGKTYELELHKPREERLPFLCHLTFTANGLSHGDLVQGMVYETPVEIDEDLLARDMVAALTGHHTYLGGRHAPICRLVECLDDKDIVRLWYYSMSRIGMKANYWSITIHRALADLFPRESRRKGSSSRRRFCSRQEHTSPIFPTRQFVRISYILHSQVTSNFSEAPLKFYFQDIPPPHTNHVKQCDFGSSALRLGSRTKRVSKGVNFSSWCPDLSSTAVEKDMGTAVAMVQAPRHPNRPYPHMGSLLKGAWGGVVVRLLACPPGEPCSIPGSSHVPILREDATGRRVFSGISRSREPNIPALLHTHLALSPSALKTSMSRAAQISSFSPPPPLLKKYQLAVPHNTLSVDVYLKWKMRGFEGGGITWGWGEGAERSANSAGNEVQTARAPTRVKERTRERERGLERQSGIATPASPGPFNHVDKLESGGGFWTVDLAAWGCKGFALRCAQEARLAAGRDTALRDQYWLRPAEPRAKIASGGRELAYRGGLQHPLNP